jgi:hypothetical protein
VAFDLDGKQLWQASFSAQYNSGTPVVVGDTVICSGPPDRRSGGKGGTVAFKVEKKDDGFAAKELWRKDQAAGIYNTPTLKDGLLYATPAAQPMRGLFWHERRDRRGAVDD